MLYVIYQQNHHRTCNTVAARSQSFTWKLTFAEAVAWASRNNQALGLHLLERRIFVFQSLYGPDAIAARLIGTPWQPTNGRVNAKKSHKQAEFLIEHSFPWELISCIGVSFGLRYIGK